jgi:hypothetical protein
MKRVNLAGLGTVAARRETTSAIRLVSVRMIGKDHGRPSRILNPIRSLRHLNPIRRHNPVRRPRLRLSRLRRIRHPKHKPSGVEQHGYSFNL